MQIQEGTPPSPRVRKSRPSPPPTPQAWVGGALLKYPLFPKVQRRRGSTPPLNYLKCKSSCGGMWSQQLAQLCTLPESLGISIRLYRILDGKRKKSSHTCSTFWDRVSLKQFKRAFNGAFLPQTSKDLCLCLFFYLPVYLSRGLYMALAVLDFSM